MLLPDRIAQVMAEKQITQTELSKRLTKLGWRREISWVCEMLKGRHRVPHERFNVMARALDMTVIELMGPVDDDQLPYGPKFVFPQHALNDKNFREVAANGCRVTLLVASNLIRAGVILATEGVTVVEVPRLPEDMWFAIPVAYDPNSDWARKDASSTDSVVPF